MAHPATLPVDELLASCTVQRTRRSGPGGQHRNKVETAVVITHRPTGIRGQASERRSQAENRQRAVFRLRVNLALQVRSNGSQKPPLISELWRSRCRNGRLSINAEHADFPALLAEALDVLTATEWDAKSASQVLGCSTSQLIKFMQLEPRAIELINEH